VGFGVWKGIGRGIGGGRQGYGGSAVGRAVDITSASRWGRRGVDRSVGVSRPGVPKPTSECAACPSPDGSSAWASAKGGKERGGRSPARERDGNPAAFVFVPRPGRVRLQ
jgi:hypothetical protein